ncbi:MAG: helix-turn-helix domain-containing protein [Parvibaculaceae bacterium]
MVDDTENPFLTVAEAAAYLRLRKRTLDNMRWMGTGPKFRKHGGRIFYHKDELAEWSKNSRRQSTSEY